MWYLIFVCIMFVLVGCSHNAGLIAIGERTALSFGPPETTASWSSTKGILAVDLARENSSFCIEIDSAEGINVDKSTGNIKGIKKITRTVGPQVTGNLVNLAKEDKELARLYIDMMIEDYRAKHASGDIQLNGK